MSACRSVATRITLISRVGRVGEHPRDEVGVGVVECELFSHRFYANPMGCHAGKWRSTPPLPKLQWPRPITK